MKMTIFNLVPKTPLFLPICSIRLLKTLQEKEKIAPNKQYRLFPHIFYPFGGTFRHFHQIQNCHLQTLLVWKSLKFVVSERVNCVVSQSICCWYKNKSGRM